MNEHSCPTCGGRGVIPADRVCANESCGKTFAWRDQPGPYTHLTGVIYCSAKCARSVASRRYRERKRGKVVR